MSTRGGLGSSRRHTTAALRSPTPLFETKQIPSRPGFRDIKLKGAVPEIAQPKDWGCHVRLQSAHLTKSYDSGRIFQRGVTIGVFRTRIFESLNVSYVGRDWRV